MLINNISPLFIYHLQDDDPPSPKRSLPEYGDRYFYTSRTVIAKNGFYHGGFLGDKFVTPSDFSELGDINRQTQIYETLKTARHIDGNGNFQRSTHGTREEFKLNRSIFTVQEEDRIFEILDVRSDAVNQNDLDAFRKATGFSATITMAFTSYWFNLKFPDRMARLMDRNKGALMIKVEPWNFEYNEPVVTKTLDGLYDIMIEAFANSSYDAGVPVGIVCGQEGNGEWYPWGARNFGGKRQGPEENIALNNYFFDKLEDYGGKYVTKIWNPYIDFVPNVTFDPVPFFPGEANTDWIGLNGFARNEAEYPEYFFKATMDKLEENFPGIPKMIAEWGALGGYSYNMEYKVRPEYASKAIDMFFRYGYSGALYFNMSKKMSYEGAWDITNNLMALRQYYLAFKRHENEIAKELATRSLVRTVMSETGMDSVVNSLDPDPARRGGVWPFNGCQGSRGPNSISMTGQEAEYSGVSFNLPAEIRYDTKVTKKKLVFDCEASVSGGRPEGNFTVEFLKGGPGGDWTKDKRLKANRYPTGKGKIAVIIPDGTDKIVFKIEGKGTYSIDLRNITVTEERWQ